MKSKFYRSRNFWLLWIIALLSTVSFGVSSMAEAWYAVKVLHLEAQFGVILTCAMLPRILFMMIGGVMADNFPKARVVSLTFALRALLVLLLAMAIPLGYAGFATVLVVTFLYGVLDAFYQPARDALIVEVIAAEHLSETISALTVTCQICAVASPALAGVLLSCVTFTTLFSMVGVLLLTCGAVILILPRTKASGAMTPRKRMREHFLFVLEELKEGLSYIRSHPQFSVLMPLFAGANLLFMGPLQQSVPLLAAKELAGSTGAFGGMWSFFTAGSLLGGLWMSFRPRRSRKFLFVLYVLLVESALLACLALTNDVAGGISVMFLIGLCVTFNNLPTAVMLQTYSDKDRIGRVMGFYDTLTMGLVPLSYLLVSGLLLAGVGHRTILACAGALMFLFCLAMLGRFPIIRTTD